MTLKECYRILELPKSADLDEIKKAYRSLAFSLHPDLNPDMPEAVRRFQEVNEAYVLLSKTLQEESRRDPRVRHRKPAEGREARPRAQAQSGAGGQAQARTKARAEAQAQPSSRAAARAREEGQAGTAAQASGRQPDTGATPGPGAAPGSKSGAGAVKTAPPGSTRGYTGHSGPKAERPRPGTTAGAFGQAGPRSDQYGPAGANLSGAGDFDLNSFRGGVFSKSDSAGAAARQEEVLGEILNDPFARRVFEDIYSELKKERGPARPPAPAPRPKKKKKISLEWGKRKMSVDLTHGIFGAVMAWLRGQLDQEQILKMPVAGIVPGARIRLRVGLGVFGRNHSVEVTLPPDYSPGAPLRLKGLGRQLGSWRGDLYLRVVPQGGPGA